MRANQILFLAVLSIGVITTSEKPALAQAEEGLVLKVYDVGDLVMDVRDYEYPGSDFGVKYVPPTGGMGGGGGGFGGGGGAFQIGGGGGGGGMGSTVAKATTMHELITVIVEVVATSTWSENGGGEADVKAFGNSLVVSQTPAVHAQIEQLLNQLRSGSGERRSVVVDARWLLMTSEMLGHLVTKGDSGLAVNREMLAELTQQPGNIRMRTSCFSGQLVYVESGTKRSIISGYIPVVGSLDDGSDAAQLASMSGGARMRFVQLRTSSGQDGGRNVGYQPIVTRPNVGAVLEIRPTLVQGSNSAIVDLKATITELVNAEGDPQELISKGPPDVDRVAIQSQELATTLRLPLGEPVLVGGMTVAPAEANPGGESPQLYLVLEVR